MRSRFGVLCLALLLAWPAAAAPSNFDALIGAAKGLMMAEPAQALAKAGEAEAVAKAMAAGPEADIARATAGWLRGEALARVNRPDRALPVLQEAHRLAVSAAPRDKLVGDILLSRGWAEGALGRVKQALSDYQDALTLYRAIDEPRGQAKALQNIGAIYSDAGEYGRSLGYYTQVAEVYRGDPAITLSAHNNLGETLKKLGRYPQAEAQYRLALAEARKLGSPLLVARILTNLASAQLLAGQTRGAQTTAREALRVAASPDAESWRPYVWGVLAQIALKRGREADAASYLDAAFEDTDLNTTPLPYRDFHQTAATLYQRQGRYQLAYAHLNALKRLDDEARALTASASAALMAARFDFANQQRRIAQRDRTISEARERLRSTVLKAVAIGGGTILTLLVIGIVSLTRSRNQVRAANASLSDVNATLERALKVKSEFLATTSHEIRTPLNGILGMTQVLLADRRVDREVKERIQLVHGAGETMKALVDDILDVAKIETGNLTIERGPVDLHGLLKDAGRLWGGRAEAKGLTLTVDLENCPARIEEDEGRLRQIIFNLMSNATKFTERGSIELRGWREGEVDDARLMLQVRDTGIGIAEDQHELIFEKFRQVDGGTSRKYGGTGLGLAICRDLSTALGGSVTVASRLGEGATFTVSLPLREIEQSTAPAAARAATLSEATLLLVEANPLKQRMLRKALTPSVGTIEGTASFVEAARMIGGQPFDHLLIQADVAAAGEEELSEGLRALAESARAAGTRMMALYDPDGGPIVEELERLGPDVRMLARPLPVSAIIAALEAVHAEQPGGARAAA